MQRCSTSRCGLSRWPVIQRPVLNCSSRQWDVIRNCFENSIWRTRTMVRLRKKTRSRTSAPGPVQSALDLPMHEGPRPDPGDTDAYTRWLAIRSERLRREVGTERDPRWLLLMPHGGTTY